LTTATEVEWATQACIIATDITRTDALSVFIFFARSVKLGSDLVASLER
jgi:hypothetical protein